MSGPWLAQLTALARPSAGAAAGSVFGDAAREAVLDALCGVNPRTRTEVATRRRMLAAQVEDAAGLLQVEAAAGADDPALLGGLAQLMGPEQPAATRRVAARTRLLRLVGLPKKTLDNLANRGEDKGSVAAEYVGMVATEQGQAARRLAELVPDLQILVNGVPVRDPHGLLLTVGTAGGSTALSVRGSDKSANGKALERVMLAAALGMLGLRQVAPGTAGDGVFWLSHLAEGDREADATVVLGEHAVKIDVGMIGDGNPEISKDKLSRYARASEVGGRRRDVTTIVVVDKLSLGSTAWDAARELGAGLVQMSDPGWVLALRDLLLAVGLDPSVSDQLAEDLRAAEGAAQRRDVLAQHLPAQAGPTD